MRTRMTWLVLLVAVLGVGPGVAYDVNKDLRNIGTQAAHDVSVVLSGTETVTNHYDGYSDRYFNSFAHGPLPPNTLLRWQDLVEPGGNGMIDPGEIVHVGWSTADHSSNVKDMYWTDATGQRIPGSKIYNITSGWTYESGTGTVLADFFNEFETEWGEMGPIGIVDLHYGIFDEAFPLSELNLGNELLNAALLPAHDGSFDVLPGESHNVTLPDPAADGQAVVLRYQATGPDSNADVVDFVQFVVPEPASLISLALAGILVSFRRLGR